ncbi:Vgr family protein [Megaselia abdita]
MCDKYEFMCPESQSCIPSDLVCNGKKDCADGEDETDKECDRKELDCPGFFCKKTKKCLESHTWVCDGYDDCGDGSDESGCAYNCNLENNKFLCNDNDTCISLYKLCDDHPDCLSHEDEHMNCHSNRCSSQNCPTASDCVMLSSGPTCACPKGFRYNELKNKCEDIDECKEKYGICSQYCLNTSGSYKCYCSEKYELLEDNRTCQTTYGEGMLLYTSQKSVVQYHLRSREIFTVADNLTQIIGITYDGEHIYWTDIQHEAEVIERVTLDGKNREELLTSGLDKPEDIAVDWLTGNLYFSDNMRSHIAVCSNHGLYCKVLIIDNIGSPRSIAVLPQNGTMFWTDWGDKPHIGRASMDGNNQRNVIETGITWPNGLTIDIFSERIYWVDAKHKRIESANYDGSDRREVLSDILMHPYSIAIFEDNLYWSDWSTTSIHTCHKYTGKDHHVVVKDGTPIYAIDIYHSSLRPEMTHSCQHNPCSHMCLLNEDMSYTCDCPYGWRLSSDHHNCTKFLKSKLYISVPNRYYLMEMEHTLFGKHLIENNIQLHFYIHEMEYNSVNHTLFLADNDDRVIYEYNLKSREVTTLFKAHSKMFNVSAMAFDPLTQNLYWSDSERHTIEVLSLKTRQTAVVHYFSMNESPIAMAIFPKLGYMFITLMSSNFHVHIDKLSLNGHGDHHHLLEDDMGEEGIQMIADWDTNTLYWVDTEYGQLKFMKVDSNDAEPHVYQSSISSPVSLAIVHDDIFWTTKDNEYVFWKHKSNNGTIKRTKIQKSANILSYYNFDESNFHPCNSNNGGCSHICVSSGALLSTCLCPIGMFFKDFTNKTCIEKEDCEFRCKNGDCLTLSRRCNGKIDCKDGSDEDEDICGKAQKKPCAVSEFTCLDGSCISIDERCDKNFDCPDRSDEQHCDKFDQSTKCQKNQFKCDSGQCIYTTGLCDGIEDCNDGSDEKDCGKKPIVCGKDMFQCTVGSCIPKSWECDGKLDCTDASDEHTECYSRDCPANSFKCHLGKCIPKSLECDDHDDCGDNSDEKDCDKSGKRKIICGEDEFDIYGEPTKFQCPSDPTICLDMKSRCNKTAECPKGEDEQGCSGCGINEFQCVKDKKCIADMFECDGQPDCEDASDEKDCNGGHPVHHNYYGSLECNRKGMFDCGDETCIDKFLVCDKHADCENGADESSMCDKACQPTNNPCEQKCVITPHGSSCECFEGYQLYNGRNCTDIDECTSTFPCSQICRNKAGSFSCSCYEGFMLTTDKFSCKSIEGGHSVYFSSYNEIRSMMIHRDHLSVELETNSTKIAGFDIDIRREKLYYTLEDQEKIYEYDLKKRITLTSLTVSSPRKVAVDWVTENVYTMSREKNGLDSIKVCNFKKKGCATIVTLTPKQVVKSLAVDAFNKKIFYSIRQPESLVYPQSTLFVANMDGSKKEVLHAKITTEIMAIAIDSYKQEVYFADRHTKTIQSIAYKGPKNMARTLVRQKNVVSIPSGLSVYENEAYIVNVGQSKIVNCKLYGEGSCSDIPINLHNAEDIVISGASRQRLSSKDACKKNECSVVCVPAQYSHKCLCHDGSVATKDNICAKIHNDIETASQIQDEDETSVAGVIGWTIFSIILVLAAVGGGYYYHQRYRSLGRHFNDNMHFQNPLSKMWPGSGTSSGIGSTISSATNSIANLQRVFKTNENGSEVVLETHPRRVEDLSRVKFRRSDENVLLEDTDDTDSTGSMGNVENDPRGNPLLF